MHVVNVRNACQAMPAVIQLLQEYGRREDSRAGPVLVAPWPVVTTTQRPRERVLFSRHRDANPFFMLVEAVWMLAGRDDDATLNYYVRDFGERFAETDGRIHDAYGRRWRYALGIDQLNAVVRRLIESPRDRQCVIQMWDSSTGVDLVGRVGENDLLGEWRTRPCNTHIYLRVREDDDGSPVLDLTVCCRSNDMLWGASSSNQVCFSVLLEYLAARIDVGIGTMYQVSNNAHVYVEFLERLVRRTSLSSASLLMYEVLLDDRYSSGAVAPQPMFAEPAAIDDDVQAFMRWHDADGRERVPDFVNPWFHNTLCEAVMAHHVHRQGETRTAIEFAKRIEAPDWRIAATEWLERRMR